MIDPRKEAIYKALSRLADDQLKRVIDAEEMVCDEFAFDASTGRY